MARLFVLRTSLVHGTDLIEVATFRFSAVDGVEMLDGQTLDLLSTDAITDFVGAWDAHGSVRVRYGDLNGVFNACVYLRDYVASGKNYDVTVAMTRRNLVI